ncbi:MAG TPA: ammonia-forming cytochrome c nitrite reductase subunit c552 [Bacillota bacterium]|nr:ammonia-forming cytochrome c nitrite reductase subunit c552 [Bacillota bacterium]
MQGRLPIIITVLIMTLSAILSGCAAGDNTAAQELPQLSAGEEDPAIWGKAYPLEYQSYLKNGEQTKTEFGGSVRESHLDKMPYLKTLFKGYGFGEDYNEERGHVYAVTDVRETKRITGKSTASCWNCKTPTAPKQIAQQGIAWYKKPFSEVSKDVRHPVTCWDCHDPKTMKLRVTRQNMINAFKRQGKDVNASTPAEMRTYVCAQCHNEYYFDKETKEVRHPWEKGLTAQAAVAYYDELKFSDWKHPQSQTEMIKMQHPEYEMGDGGVHRSAGVSCADCHMPYMRKDSQKYSSHWMTSPVKNLDISCKPCHRQTTAWLKERIHDIQVKTNELVNTAGEENAKAIRAIEAAAKESPVDTAKLDQARKHHRTGQAYWDWVAAENSMGFHNPQKAMYTLGLAINNAREAQLLAAQAVGKPLKPAGDIIPKQQTDPVGQPKQPADKPEFPAQP